ncbi:hypothetical protein QQS21_009805 [Conoideocrella luteorostrata]|uniref:Nicotinamide-nucleotide adenylyltransferase n=1 Tax=Conoideocrella luteorostrata TaxID=1105319 RepID=A0AAJ0CGJ5_9HYPO|nr:hypothetical protein QQS21_009805 [Conoideocrella luteorostrata]
MDPSQMGRNQTLQFFTRSLAAFQSSRDAFRVLSTVPPSASAPGKASRRPVRKLIILDSSFNPPTRAHAQMARSAVREAGPGAKLMLLLAVQNADKGVVPAALEVRLGMMEGLARELVHGDDGFETGTEEARTRNTDRDGGGDDGLVVDLAVTTMPFFHDKAKSIAESGIYDSDGEAEQVFLCGFDTVIRIFNPKYYVDQPSTPSTRSLHPSSQPLDNSEQLQPVQRALGPFFARAKLRVTMRPDDEWGTAEEQRMYVESLEKGGLEGVGGDKAWARRIELVEGVEGVVSSSMVRRVVRDYGGDDDGGALDDLVGGEVRRWIRGERLYKKE